MTKYVVQGSMYSDRNAEFVIQTPIGPFDTFDDADLFMWKMRPVWGDWEIVPLATPHDIADRVGREAAADFIPPAPGDPIPAMGLAELMLRATYAPDKYEKILTIIREELSKDDNT